MSREAKRHLEAYLQWRLTEGEVLLRPDSPMFLCQDPKHQGERLGCKGLYKMVKKVAITRKGLDPLYGKDLMGIKSDKVYRRYTQGALKQSAAKAYLQAIGEDED